MPDPHRHNGEADRRRECVRAALAAAGEAGRSGEEIAAEAGCSRATVHRHVQALRRQGLEIEGGATGYRLIGAPDLVVPSLVASRLQAPLSGPVLWSAEVGSTNEEAARLARAGADEGLVVGADHQATGRGRRGRTWVDRPGDALMFSLVLRPPLAPVDVGILPILIAVGVSEAVSRHTAAAVQIAWPNDVIADGRKVAGILMELSADQHAVHWAVAGVGINVRSAPTIADARWQPGSLADVGADRPRADLLVECLRSIGGRYRDLLGRGPGAVLDGFAARDHLAGRPVTVATPAGDIRARAAGVDPLGRLRLEHDDGSETRVAAGEVVRVEA